jgi:hypothetical protein
LLAGPPAARATSTTKSSDAAEKARARAFADAKLREAREEAKPPGMVASSGATVDLVSIESEPDVRSSEKDEPMPESGGGDAKTTSAEEEHVEYGGGGEADESDDDDTKIRVPRFSIPAGDVDDVDEEMKSGVEPGDRPADDPDAKKRKHATRPVEVIPLKASKKKRVEARYSGALFFRSTFNNRLRVKICMSLINIKSIS